MRLILLGCVKLIKREYERNKSLDEFNSLCDLINTYAPEKGNKGLNQKTKIIEVTFEDNTTKRFESINEDCTVFRVQSWNDT